jgi:hypothetical protein
MKNRFWLITIVLAIALAAAAVPSGAAEWKGVDFPDQIQVDGATLVLNGLGLRQATAFKVSVYIAGLYVTARSGDPQAILQSPAPKRLVLHFLRNVGSSDLTEAWDDGFQKNAADQIPVLKDRIEKIKSFTKDMKTGQKLTFTYRPGTGIVVDIDGAVMGTVEGDDFSKAFLSIWLGPNPPNKNLKNGLLGGDI